MTSALNLNKIRGLLLAVMLAVGGFVLQPAHALQADAEYVLLAELPPEARNTLQLIKQGGPFPYPRDGVVFGNFEKRLPKQPRGYYHEYTVKTPGVRNRGARRIVCGRAADCYYTADHYQTFKRIRE